MSGSPLQVYFAEVEKVYETGKATEQTYRSALKILLEALGTDIAAINEPKRVKCGAPDYVIERDNLTIGYIEAKDIGISLDKVEKDEQLKRYRNALDNLILTDYLEFRWYVDGEKRMVATLATSGKGKGLSWDKNGADQVEELLKCFLAHSAEPIRKPQELARRIARLAHMIRDIIIDVFKQKEASDNLKDLYSAFQEVLLPDLKASEFADMFAQTIAYGLFAARCNHTQKSPFRRDNAAREIPRINPFLRKLFGAIAGPDLDDEPFIGFVDELAQVLAYTDMDAVMAEFGKRTRQDDPIVHFYETFLVQYDSKLRELRGVYYTPEPVVSYIVRSVEALLRTHFDCYEGLADTGTVTHSYIDEEGKEHTEQTPHVLILDPATGTATFLYHVIAHIRESYRQMGNAGMWSGYMREHLLPRLFGFELLMAPYAMAHLKLGMQLAAIDLPKEERAKWAYDFKSDERLGIYLTNTLDEAIKRSQVMFGRYISDEANEAAKVKQGYPVMVILGNPPYSGHSANKGQWINDLLRGKDSQTGKSTGNYFAVDGKPLGERNPKWLNDDYVKFIRFAQWRIEQTGYGILAFITNHGYLDNPTFRGMRQSLMQSFDEIYLLDLHGNSKKKERSPDGSKDENIFDIQQGVAVGIFVKRQKANHASRAATVRHAHLWGPRYEKADREQQRVKSKYNWLAENDITTTDWTKLEPKAPFYLFVPQSIDLHAEYDNGWRIPDIFPLNSVGIATARDDFTISFIAEEIWKKVNDFISLPVEEARSKYELGEDTRDWQVNLAQQDLRNSGPSRQHLASILYRPFDKRHTYYTGKSRGFHCMPRGELMKHILFEKNIALITSRSIEIGRGWEHIFCTRDIIQHHSVSLKEVNYLFPLYLYDGIANKGTLFDSKPQAGATSGRYTNFAIPFIKTMEDKFTMSFIPEGNGDLQQTFGPEDIFSYMYAIFHSPAYRERYAEVLKIDFPR